MNKNTLKLIKKIFKKDNRIKAIACYRRNVSCKNCYEFGKCDKQAMQKPKIKWFNIMVYGGMMLMTALLWYFIILLF